MMDWLQVGCLADVTVLHSGVHINAISAGLLTCFRGRDNRLKFTLLFYTSCRVATEQTYLKPVLNWVNACSPNILRTLRRTMIRFLIELLVRRTWFGQSKLYVVLNWLVMRCKLRPELAADAQQTA